MIARELPGDEFVQVRARRFLAKQLSLRRLIAADEPRQAEPASYPAIKLSGLMAFARLRGRPLGQRNCCSSFRATWRLCAPLDFSAMEDR